MSELCKSGEHDDCHLYWCSCGCHGRNHSAGHFARGPINTNGIESVWAVLKRGVNGVFHHISVKHTERYVDEFTFRLNVGNVKIHTLVRLGSFVDAVAGRRLTYKELTA